MKKHLILLLTLACTACGSYKAVRPDAPSPTVAEPQLFTIQYKAIQGKGKIRALYNNSNTPLTVDLQQNGKTETLSQVTAWAKGAEYSNTTTRWYVEGNKATLTRDGKRSEFIESD